MDGTAPLVRLAEPPLIDPVTPLVTAYFDGGPLDALVILPDGDTCVADNGCLQVVSLSTGAVKEVEVSDCGVGVMALAGGGRLVTTGGSALRVWDTERWSVIAHLADLDHRVTSIAAAGDVVVTGGRDGARVWDLAAFSCRFELSGAGAVTDVAVTLDGSHAITLGRDDRVVWWELTNGTAVRAPRGLVPSWPDRLTASRPSDGVVAVGAGERVRVFDRDGGLIGVLGPALAPVRALAFAPDGRLVCGLSGQVDVWSADLDPRWSARQAHTNSVWRTAVDHTGRYGRSIAHDTETRLWDLTCGRPLAEADLPGDIRWHHPAGISHFVGAGTRLTSDDGTRVVTLEEAAEPPREHRVTCRDLPAGAPRWTWAATDRHDEDGWYPRWIVLPPHSGVVLVCTEDVTGDDPASVSVLDLETGWETRRFSLPGCRRSWPQVLGDGSVFLLYDDPGRARCLARLDWQAGAASPYLDLPGRFTALVCAGGLVLTADGNEVQLVAPGDSRPVARLALPARLGTSSPAASPDGRTVLAGDDHGGVHIFRITPG